MMPWDEPVPVGGATKEWARTKVEEILDNPTLSRQQCVECIMWVVLIHGVDEWGRGGMETLARIRERCLAPRKAGGEVLP